VQARPWWMKVALGLWWWVKEGLKVMAGVAIFVAFLMILRWLGAPVQAFFDATTGYMGQEVEGASAVAHGPPPGHTKAQPAAPLATGGGANQKPKPATE
jgi:hypothetical protein